MDALISLTDGQGSGTEPSKDVRDSEASNADEIAEGRNEKMEDERTDVVLVEVVDGC